MPKVNVDLNEILLEASRGGMKMEVKIAHGILVNLVNLAIDKNDNKAMDMWEQLGMLEY